jgi:hypothetical protein
MPKTRLAQLIARNEGFGLIGTVPTKRNNPGDLRHSPHASHVGVGPNDIGIIDTVEHGWEDLERQLQLFADRGDTLEQLAYTYAPPGDDNPTEAYLQSILKGLGVDRSYKVSDALKIKAL